LHPPPPPAPEIDSLIVSEYPPLFEEFRAKRFNLLWRDSRDGFTAQEFHLRCDSRANTLTLISDTDGNVFGGFTPVKWEPHIYGTVKGDNSLRSFLFTLRNPHGVPPRKFALKAEMNQYAIHCHPGHYAKFGYSAYCPSFGFTDIHVSDNCNTNRNSHTKIGTLYSDSAYANDTAFEDFLTGAEKFTVKEIEVFEIADYTALPADVKKSANGCLFQERARDAGAGATGRLWETQAGDSASGKATNTRGGCSWRTSSRGRRGECMMCSWEEDERLVEVEGGRREQRYQQARREKEKRLSRGEFRDNL
jgi:hypothetical protein